MKKRNGILARIGIVALVLTLVTSTMTSGTLAKYMTISAGTVNALVAEWNASTNIVYGSTNQSTQLASFEKSLSELTKNSYTGVTSGEIAPGMSGNFTIAYDLTGTDVTTNVSVYVFVDGDSEAYAPAKLTFKYKSSTVDPMPITSTQWTEIQNGTADFSTFTTAMLTEEKILPTAKQDGTLPIDWEWPFDGNDASDTADGAGIYSAIKAAGDGATESEYAAKYYIVVRMVQVDPASTT